MGTAIDMNTLTLTDAQAFLDTNTTPPPSNSPSSDTVRPGCGRGRFAWPTTTRPGPSCLSPILPLSLSPVLPLPFSSHSLPSSRPPSDSITFAAFASSFRLRYTHSDLSPTCNKTKRRQPQPRCFLTPQS